MRRREFIRALAAGTGTALLRGQTRRTFRIGCATLAWNVSPNAIDTLELALKDISELGYWGFETVSPMIEALDGKGGLTPLMDRYNIPMLAAYMDADVMDISSRRENVAKVIRVSNLVKTYGGSYVVIGVNARVRGQAFDFSKSKVAIVSALNEFGRAAVDSGLLAGLHPHTGTVVDKRDEVYGVMEAVNPKYMGFAPDVGQLQKGGADAAQIVKDLAPLITHVHLKDYSGGKYMAGYCPLGMGVVDIEGILNTLEAAGRNPGIVHELDRGNAHMTARETAAFSKAYLKRLGYVFRN